MNVFLITGLVFLLLILICWLVYRRAQTESPPRPTMSNLSAANFGPEVRPFEDDVELGPIMRIHADAAGNHDRSEGASETSDYWEWRDDFAYGGDDSTDRAVRADWVADQSAEGEDENWVDSQSAEADDQVWNDGDAVQTDAEPVEEWADQPPTSETAVFVDESVAEYENEAYEEGVNNGLDVVEPSPVTDPQFGVQTNLPLRTTENNPSINGEDATMIERIRVDETIQFPNFSNSNRKAVDMLGWIPSDGTTVSRTQLLAFVRDFGENIKLPVSIFAQLVDSEVWVNLKDENVAARFEDLILTMQLTHFGESVDEQTWWHFYNMGETIANTLSRSFYPSLSLESALLKSRELTEQVDNLNIQAIMILQSKNSRELSATTLDYLAREYKLVKRGDGLFEKMDLLPTSSLPLYTMTTDLPANPDGDESDEEIGLALYSNLPCVRDPMDAFDQMVSLARNLESRFAWVLVGEDRQRILPAEIDVIRKHIQTFVDDMNYCEIVPGGETAIRLFHVPDAEDQNSRLSDFTPER